MAEPRILPLDAVDEEAVLALVRLGLGAGSAPRSVDFWRWKHRAGPFGPSPGLVAVAGGEVVALRLFSRWRLRDRGSERAAVRAVDTATHPDWRRRGLFRRLTAELVEQVAAEGAALVFNTPNRASFRGYRRLGWRSAGRVPLSVRPLGTGILHGGRDAPPRLTAGWSSPAGVLARPGVDRFLAALWQDEPRLHTPRDAAYLAWRYAAVPGIGYGAMADVEGDAGALVVARPRLRRGRGELALAEVLVGRGEESARRAARLLARVGAAAAEGGADYLVAVASRTTAERRALAGAGFLTLPAAGPRLAVRRLAAADAPGSPLPASLRTGAWRWSLGDLELF